MQNLYSVLGVDRDADADAIKRAYRRLAAQHHPDRGGDTARFQEIQQAYDVLGDLARRREYDNPTTNANAAFNPGGFDFDTIFQMFGARFGDSRPSTSAARIQLWISLADAVQGSTRTISVSSPAGQQHIEITIPRAIEDGASVRYHNLAPGGMDLVITYRVRPETAWSRQDLNLVHDAVISIWDLILGADIEITTLSGKKIIVTVPPHTNPGTVLRVRAHGIQPRSGGTPGDLLVRIGCRLPDTVSAELQDLIRSERGR